MTKRLCVNCEKRRPKWRPAYSPLRSQFCTQRCSAAYAHELVAGNSGEDMAALAAREVEERLG